MCGAGEPRHGQKLTQNEYCSKCKMQNYKSSGGLKPRWPCGLEGTKS